MKKLLAMVLILAMSLLGTAVAVSGAGETANEEDGSGAPRARYTIPEVPEIKVPDIKVPDVPERSEDDSKIRVPQIPQIDVPGVDISAVTAPEAGAEIEEAVDASGKPGEIPARQAPAQAVTAFTEAVLDALGEEVYRTTYEALLSGEIVERGSKGDAAKGVQQTLAAFGQDIAVDGNVGPKTLAALNAVQRECGLVQTASLDAAGYAELLAKLLAIVDPDAADALPAANTD